MPTKSKSSRRQDLANARRRARVRAEAEAPADPEPEVVPDVHCGRCGLICVWADSIEQGTCRECRGRAERLKQQAKRIYKGGTENVGKAGRVLYRVHA